MSSDLELLDSHSQAVVRTLAAATWPPTLALLRVQGRGLPRRMALELVPGARA